MKYYESCWSCFLIAHLDWISNSKRKSWHPQSFSILCCRLRTWPAAFSTTWHLWTAFPWRTHRDHPQCRAPPSLPSPPPAPWWAPWAPPSPTASTNQWAFRLEAWGWAFAPQAPASTAAWPPPPAPQTLEPSRRIKDRRIKPPTCQPWTVFLHPASPKSPSTKWAQSLQPTPLG